MPNMSTGYAVGSVRVRERSLMNSEKLDRLIAAPSARDALKLLQEYGYGGGSDATDPQAYEKWLAESMAEAVEFLRRVTPDERIANAFLMDVDYHNLKALFKARELKVSVDQMMQEGGQIPVAALKEAVSTGAFGALPKSFQQACEKLRKELNVAFDPQRINCTFDSAMTAEATRLLTEAGFEAGVSYYRAWTDKANLMAALRLRAMKRQKSAFSAAFLPGGRYAENELLAAWDDLSSLPSKREYATFMPGGLKAWQETGASTQLERAFENHLLDIFIKRRYNNQGYEPVVGYFLARKREIDNIRLIMVSKINGLPMSTVTERLRDPYE